MPDRRKRRRKTSLMEVVELRHDGKSIEDIMVAAFKQHGTEREAAQTIGVTQQTFTQWKYRLGLDHLIFRGAAEIDQHSTDGESDSEEFRS